MKLNLFGQLAMKFEDQVADDDSKGDTSDLLDKLANATTDEDKADINRRLNDVQDQAMHNARARAHNAFGAYREAIK